jgi:hypothetical protein
MNFAYEVSVFIVVLLFNVPQSRTICANGFTSHPNEVVCGFLSPLKIYPHRPGLNPLTLGPVTSTLSTRPPRATLQSMSNRSWGPTSLVCKRVIPPRSKSAGIWYWHDSSFFWFLDWILAVRCVRSTSFIPHDDVLWEVPVRASEESFVKGATIIKRLKVWTSCESLRRRRITALLPYHDGKLLTTATKYVK